MKSGGNILKWKDGRIAMQLSRTVHLENPESGVAHEETAASLHTAVMEAIRQWNETGRALVTVEASLTDETKVQPGLNLITFTDTAPFESGQCDKQIYIACTILTFVQETGEIQNVSIAFNPYLRHSSIGLMGTHDVGLVMMHEMGHAAGLDHSPLLDAVMAASVELASQSPGAEIAYRQLSSDDVLTLALVYPLAEPGENTPGRNYGTIRGTIQRNDQPLEGANVFAFDLAGRPIYGSLSEPNGSYSLELPAGEYRLAAEPLDGPALASQMVSPPTSANPFPTTFWTAGGGQSNTADTITVCAGQIRAGIDFAVPDLPVVNAESIGLVQSGLYLGGHRVTVGRGREYLLGLTRSPPNGNPDIGFWQAPVLAVGLANFPNSAPQLVRQKIQIADDAVPGAYIVHYYAEDTGSVLAGALRIVPSPAVTSILDAATGLELSAYAAGQLLSIKGTGLAIADAVAQAWAEGSVRPNQLAGSSVRIGGRWAPLFAVSPSEIVVEVPAGLTGESAELRVVTGAGVESDAITLNLAQ
ncbi:MAG: matrixin family metalloprotease [Acidobacteriia bacterium]|nr:matrixin family metalloprotease [Terriglobia bacterium]